jgi:hypothetical protein
MSDLTLFTKDIRSDAEGMQSIFSPEDIARLKHSERYPAFQGVIRIPLTLGLASKKSKRLLRVKYTYTPEWEYYDLQKSQLMHGWLGWSREYEIWTVPSNKWIDGKPRWIGAETFLEVGVFSWEQELLIDYLIEMQCRQEDRRRRKAAGLKTRRKPVSVK